MAKTYIQDYYVENMSMVCNCTVCFWPIDRGDTAYSLHEDDSTCIEAGFCSRKCAQKWEKDQIDE